MLTDDERWVLSFYRTSEIAGALFFGRLAKSLRASPIQHDLTKHFSDEAVHAWYWTDCLARMGAEPLRLREAYQDQYFVAAGMPANLMEVLAITQVFERRVIHQYALHSRVTGLAPAVKETLERIMVDEKWHIEWVRAALKRMEPEYGPDVIEATVRRFWEADQAVYQKTMGEHEARVHALMQRAEPGGPA
jgi:hypothetical protein